MSNEEIIKKLKLKVEELEARVFELECSLNTQLSDVNRHIKRLYSIKNDHSSPMFFPKQSMCLHGYAMASCPLCNIF